MGRWQSGAPLALCPMQDDPELGADPKRNNDFLFNDDDPKGLKTPPGSHIRRMNPRDSDISRCPAPTSHDPARHQLRPDASALGSSKTTAPNEGWRSSLSERDLERQFEFVQSEWVNRTVSFSGLPGDKDPIVGANDGSGQFTIPQQPIRRRLHGLPASSSRGAGSISSHRACGPCAGWRLSRRNELVVAFRSAQRNR